MTRLYGGDMGRARYSRGYVILTFEGEGPIEQAGGKVE